MRIIHILSQRYDDYALWVYRSKISNWNTNIYFQKTIQEENINDILLHTYTSKSVFLLSFFIIFSRLLVTHLLYSMCLNKCVPLKTTCTHNYVVSLKKIFFWNCCFIQWFSERETRCLTLYRIWNLKYYKYAI